MTTPSTERKAGPLLGTGAQTTWPFTFKVFAATDIAVTIADSLGVETTLVYGVDYTVALNANQETSPGGTVTYPIAGSPLPVGKRLVIVGNLPYDQPLDLPSGGNFSPLALENQLDRLTMQIQQLRENLCRALQVSVSTGANIALPSPAANELIGWDSTAQNLQNFALSELATAVAYATMRYDTFTGDGAETEFTLTADPVTPANLDVAIGGVTQTPGSDYSLASGVLVFASAPPNGAEILARYGEGLVNVGGDSSDIRYLPAGTGAQERTVQNKLRDVFSVLDFGADPTGATDSTPAFDAALAAIYTSGSKGAKLVFPQGTYRGQVKINGLTNNSMGENGLCISGYGAMLKGRPGDSSVICVSGAVAGTPIVPPINAYANGLRIEGFTIDMTGMPAAASTYGIAIQLSYNSSMEDIHVIYEPNAGGGLYLGNQVYTYSVRNLNCARVWLLGYNNTSNQTSTCSFWNLVAEQVIVKNCFDISFFSPIIQGSRNHFILDDANTINIIGGDLEGTGGYVYEFLNSTRNVNSIANTPGGYTYSTYSTGLAYNSNLADRPPLGGQGIGTYGRVNSPGRVILSATTAQTIFEFLDTPANQGLGLVSVFGDDGTNGFADLVMCAYSAVAVVSSNTMYGSPPTRTYSFSSNQLKLARSAATAGAIKAVLIEALTSN
jgi:hypothetical protein